MSIVYPNRMVRRVYELTPELFWQLGIRGLILDVDNTLTTHDNPIPDPKVLGWLETMRSAGLKMMIVSNNHPQRVVPFSNQLGLPFVADGMKPLTRGLREACRQMGTAPKTTAVIGDQIFTDVLGGNLLGAYTILVEPISSEETRLIRLKRKLERGVLRRYRRRQESPHMERKAGR